MQKEGFNKSANDNDVIDIRGAINKMIFHWPLYVLLFAISIIGAKLYLRYTRPIYSSSGKIYIKDSRGRSSQGALDDLSMFSSAKVVENEMEVIKSPLILESVIRDKKFNVRYFLKGKVVSKELYNISPIEVKILTDSGQVGTHYFEVELLNNQKIKIKYGNQDNPREIITMFNRPFYIGKDQFEVAYSPSLNDNHDKEFEVNVDSIMPMAYRKAGEIQTSLVSRMGSVFELSYEDESPERAADFLNAVLTAYNQYTLDDKNKITLNTIRFIESRLASLGDELNVLEREVENFKKSRGITELGESSKLVLDQAREADQRLSQSDIQLAIYDEVENYINSPNISAPFTPVYGNVDPALNNLINRYEDALRERARLSLSVQPGNPLLQEVEQQIANTKNTIRNYISGYRRNAITEKSGIQSRVKKVEGLINKIPTYEREFINIQRQQSVKEGLYNFLLQRKEEASVAYASNIVDNKIISPAYIPSGPIKPKRLMILLYFTVGSLLLATLYIRLKYLFNNKITNKKEIISASNIPIVAEIYNQPEAKGRIINLAERSVLTEQILNLRNNVKFLLATVNHPPIILFTSCISGEGKTFISSHLANALTANNKSVILLELDLRKPKLSQSLGVSNATGITNYLIGSESFTQIIKKVPGNDRLFIIPSGPIPPNPIELLESERMRDLLGKLRQQYDYIVIDTSPVGMVSDAKSLAPYIDCAMFVIRFNYTPQAKFKEIAADVEAVVSQRMGIIFNGVDMESSYGYYSYGYSNYGYGYGTSASSGKVARFFKTLKHRLI